jgi:hypothetical protein
LPAEGYVSDAFCHEMAHGSDDEALAFDGDGEEGHRAEVQRDGGVADTEGGNERLAVITRKRCVRAFEQRGGDDLEVDVNCSEEGVAREDCLCRHDEGGELVEEAAREGNRFAAGIELDRICDGLVLRDLVSRERFDVGIASSVGSALTLGSHRLSALTRRASRV